MIEQICSSAALAFLIFHYYRISCLERQTGDGSATTECQIEASSVSGTCCMSGDEMVCRFRTGGQPNCAEANANEPSTSGVKTTKTAPPKKPRKPCKPGILTRNAFMNFVRKIREEQCGLSQPEIVKEAAKQWKLMTTEQKSQYQSRCTGGRMTRNAFLNYCREVRGMTCGRPQTEIIKEAAREWRKLSKEEKEQYNQMARRIQRRQKVQKLNVKRKNNRKNQQTPKN